MELDEFKELWKSAEKAGVHDDEISNEKINTIIMNATNTLEKIRKANLAWWKLITRLTEMLIGVFIVAVFVNFVISATMPNLLPSFAPVLAYSLSVILVLKWLIWTNDRHSKIFEVNGDEDLASTIKKVIDGFNKYQKVSILGSILFNIAVVYFAYASTFTLFFKTESSWAMNLGVSVSLTLIFTVWTYINYKKTYFKWIDSLKKDLKELEEN